MRIVNDFIGLAIHLAIFSGYINPILLGIDSPKINEIEDLLVLAYENISEDEKNDIKTIVKEKDRKSYDKVIKILKSRIPQ